MRTLGLALASVAVLAAVCSCGGDPESSGSGAATAGTAGAGGTPISSAAGGAPGTGGTGGAAVSSTSNSTITSSAETSTGNGGGQPGTPECRKTCADRLAANCSQDASLAECEADCAVVASAFAYCDSALGAAQACTSQREGEWVCDEGHSALPAGVCAAEEAAALACVCLGPGGDANPSFAGVCDDYCAKDAATACPDPDCMAFCESAIAKGEPLSPVFGASFECAAGVPVDNWTCSDGGYAAPASGFCELEYAYTFLCAFTVSSCACGVDSLCGLHCNDTLCADPALPASDACKACLANDCFAPPAQTGGTGGGATI